MDINAINSFLRASLHNIGVSEDVISSAHFDLAPLAHADLTSAVAFTLTKTVHRPPREIAENIVVELKKNNGALQMIGSLEVVGAGYINLTFTDELLWKQSALSYRPLPQKRGVRPVLIDYSSPNVAKPMGVQHLRSTIIGESLSRVYEFLGHRVVRLNHLGDWGTQFGKLIVMIADERIKPSALTIDSLVKLYVQFHELAVGNPELEERARLETKKLQEGDRRNRDLWKKIVALSIKEFQKTYKQLGIRFDEIRGESSYNKDLEPIVERLLAAGIAQKSNGAVIIPLPGISVPMVIQKSDGAYLYATTDLAAVRYRIKKFNPSKILYVVANQQTLHFQQLLKAVELAKLAPTGVLKHIKFGMIVGKGGKKLSTREGTSVGLDEMIKEAIERARAIIAGRPQRGDRDLQQRNIDRIARSVGLGALKFNDLSSNRTHDEVLDWDAMLNFSGSSAPYLQYSAVRIQSILRKAEKRSADIVQLRGIHERERDLLRRLVRFESIVGSAAQTNEPHRIAEYLLDLASSVHRLYEHSPVLTADKKDRTRRIILLERARNALKQGLWLLGIETPSKM